MLKAKIYLSKPWNKKSNLKSLSGLKKSCLLIFLTILFLINCTKNHLKLAEDLKRNKHYEDALSHYFKALKSEPDRIDLKIDIDRLLKEASRYYYYLGQEQEKMHKKELAVYLYKKSLEFDPANNQSRSALSELIGQGEKTKSLDTIKKETAINLGLPEVLKKEEKIDLIFKNKVSLMKIFEVLSKSGQVNILFDSSFRDKKLKLSLWKITFHQALERICTMGNYSYYILDNNNIIITNKGSESKRKYKKLLIKNIYFSNVAAQEAKTIIESLFRPERLIINKLTNSLIVSDSLENIALCEKIAQFIDKRTGELEVEVEIMEVDQKKLNEYGAELSAYQIGAEVEGFSEGKRFNDLFYLGSDDVIFSMPKMVWKFFSSVTDSKILARPKIRGLDRERIEIQLGEKRPIPRTTFVPFAGGGVEDQPITSYDMKDVGIAISIMPTIHHNRDVTLKLNFELTYVTDMGGAYVPPTLGNRKVTTRLRLRDGESGIIAGLMKGITTGSREGVPLLNAIPIIKEIFSSKSKIHERVDILISITPRILRMPEITRNDLEAYLIGTGEKVILKKWQRSKHTKIKQ